MVKPRKMYDREFKVMVVELIEPHKTVAEVSGKCLTTWTRPTDKSWVA